MANPFLDVVQEGTNTQAQPVDTSNPFTNLVQEGQQPATTETNTFGAMLDGFNRQFEKAAIGTMQLGSYLVPGAGQFRERLADLNKYGNPSTGVVGENQANRSYSEHPMAYGVGAVGGMVGSAAATGGPLAAGAKAVAPSIMGAATNTLGQFGARTLAGAGSGAGYGAIMPANDLGEHGLNALAGGLMGSIASNIIPAIKGVKDAVTGQKSYASSFGSRIFTPEKAAIKDVAAVANDKLSTMNPSRILGEPIDNTMENANYLQSLVDDSKQLGMNPMPSQVTGSGKLASMENQAAEAGGLSGSRQMAFKLQPEVDKLQTHMTNLIKNMAPEEVHAAEQQLYGQMANINIADDAASALLQNPTIAKYAGDLSNQAISKGDLNIGELANNNMAKLDYIKQVIGDRLWNDKHAIDASNKMPKDLKDSLKTAYGLLNNTLATQSPDLYPVATATAQKVAVQKNYLNLVQQIRNSPNTNLNLPEGVKLSPEQLNGFGEINKINSALFGTDNKVQAFLKDIQTVGGDLPTAKAVIQVANKFAGVNVDKTLAQHIGTLPDFMKSDSKSGMIKNFVMTLTNGRYEKALLDLVTSGDKWVPLVKQEIIKQTSAKAKAEGFMKVILEASKQPIQGTVAGNIGSAIVPNGQ